MKDVLILGIVSAIAFIVGLFWFTLLSEWYKNNVQQDPGYTNSIGFVVMATVFGGIIIYLLSLWEGKQ